MFRKLLPLAASIVLFTSGVNSGGKCTNSLDSPQLHGARGDKAEVGIQVGLERTASMEFRVQTGDTCTDHAFSSALRAYLSDAEKPEHFCLRDMMEDKRASDQYKGASWFKQDKLLISANMAKNWNLEDRWLLPLCNAAFWNTIGELLDMGAPILITVNRKAALSMKLIREEDKRFLSLDRHAMLITHRYKEEGEWLFVIKNTWRPPHHELVVTHRIMTAVCYDVVFRFLWPMKECAARGGDSRWAPWVHDKVMSRMEADSKLPKKGLLLLSSSFVNPDPVVDPRTHKIYPKGLQYEGPCCQECQGTGHSDSSP